MHHDRLFARAVFGDILQSEAGGKIEVELNGRKLPESANGIDQLDVNLWAVERRFTGDRLVLDPELLHNFF